MEISALVESLNALLHSAHSKKDFHFQAHKHLLAAAKSKSFLNELIIKNLVQPNFFNQSHYPVPSFPVFRNAEYELVVNCWIPYPDKSIEISTKSLHHHGPMLLSTITIFGPGYQHWLFKPAKNVDGTKCILDLIDYNQHGLYHIAFVDAFHVHVPMYPKELSLTLALWTSSQKSSVLDHLKSQPFISKNKLILSQLISKLGMSKLLRVKQLKNLDYYPVTNGFTTINFRSDTEYCRGPVEHRIQTLFSIIQNTIGPDIFNMVDLQSIISNEFNSSPQLRSLSLKFANSLKQGITILPILTPGLHTNQQLSNFSSQQISASASLC